jgi:hypothetical protein
VIPADSKAAKATSEVMQGLIRHIERTSRAQIAYEPNSITPRLLMVT